MSEQQFHDDPTFPEFPEGEGGQGQRTDQPGGNWDEVLAQLKQFGETLGRAIEQSWNDPKTQSVVDQVKDGLNQAAQDVDIAIEKAKTDPTVKQFGEDAKDAWKELEDTGKEAVEKAKPHLINAMKNLNEAFKNVLGGKEDDTNPPT